MVSSRDLKSVNAYAGVIASCRRLGECFALFLVVTWKGLDDGLIGMIPLGSSLNVSNGHMSSLNNTTAGGYSSHMFPSLSGFERRSRWSRIMVPRAPFAASPSVATLNITIASIPMLSSCEHTVESDGHDLITM